MINACDINNTLDGLLLEFLNLIQQHIECRVNIERLRQLLLAKTRYTQGSQTVSVAQLPTENKREFKALCGVVTEPNGSAISGYRSELINYEANKLEGYEQPLHWFSVLPPTSLKSASECFKKSLPLIVESANIQREILSIMDKIEHLQQLKNRV